MVKKFFPFDKNYLLERAQHESENFLLNNLIKVVLNTYESRINPLGLEDSFTLKIRNYKPGDLAMLHNFYEKAAAIYRYKFGGNQLEFLWDGTDHFDFYLQEWPKVFIEWIDKFCEIDLFIQAVLDLTVFNSHDEHSKMTENRMEHFILKYFDAKIHKVKGLMVA